MTPDTLRATVCQEMRSKRSNDWIAIGGLAVAVGCFSMLYIANDPFRRALIVICLILSVTALAMAVVYLLRERR